MIIMPNNYRYQYANTVDSWNVYGLNVGKSFDINIFGDCESISSGAARFLKLRNINGKYIKSEQTYNNNPVYINFSYTTLVTGPGFGDGVNFFNLNQYERLEIIQNPDVYTVFRDGPYLLGKFGVNDEWSIIKLPESFDNNNSFNLNDIVIGDWSENDILNSVVISQVSTLPPISMKDSYYESRENIDTINNNLKGKNKRYSSWVNKTNPLSRNWTIQEISYARIKCEPLVEQKLLLAKNHFYPTLSNVTDLSNPDKFVREPIKITSGTPFYKRVYDEYEELINAVNEKLFGDNFSVGSNGIQSYAIAPPVINDLRINLTTGDEDNYLAGVFKNLGEWTEDPTSESSKILYLDINGHFINTNTVKSILYGAKFIIDSVDITPEWSDDNGPVIINVSNSDFKTKLDNVTQNLISWTEQTMSEWAKKTAFLYPPTALENSWIQAAQGHVIVINENDFGTKYRSRFTKKYLFIDNSLAKYYDRLYEFMQSRTRGVL